MAALRDYRVAGHVKACARETDSAYGKITCLRSWNTNGGLISIAGGCIHMLQSHCDEVDIVEAQERCLGERGAVGGAPQRLLWTE